MTSADYRWLPPALVAFATLCVAWLQLRLSQAPYYGYDEAWHLYLASVTPLTKALEEMAVDPHPPLYYFLLRPLTQLGPEPFWLRLPSVLATIATVPLWYALLRKLDLRPAVAVAITITLATSHGFIELGLTVRAYSLAALCLVAALWFWCDFVGVERAKPSRASARALLGLLTTAFWFSYYAVFFSIALLAASVFAAQFNGTARAALVSAWQRFVRWPERLAVVLLHLLAIAWFVVGFGRAGLAAPPHVSPFLFDGQQPLSAYLLQGLRGYLTLFTPFGELPTEAQLGVMSLLICWLIWQITTALRQGATAHSAILLSILLVLSLLFVTGVVGLYPFGGYLRHQHLLLLLFLIAFGIGLNQIYGRLNAAALRAVGLFLVVALAFGSSAVTTRRDPLGESPQSRPLAREIGAAFDAGMDRGGVYVPVYAFYPVYADRFGNGITYQTSYGHLRGRWVDIAEVGGPLQQLGVRREWDSYRVNTLSGESVDLYRDRRVFELPHRPEPAVLAGMRELMDQQGLNTLRILSASPSDSQRPSTSELESALLQHGLRLLQALPGDQGGVWLIGRRSDSSAAGSP
jgi:hypothetical protein